jgi:TetR/AcrR family transcriptional repressor of nem operon
MGHSRVEKAASHDRILTLAAERLRADGLASLNIAELMAAAGLTHGGFYRHFPSREALTAEALQRAFADGEAHAGAAAGGAPRTPGAIARSYLSRAHRDHPETGCAITALAGDIARADTAAQALLADRFEASVKGMESRFDDGDTADARRKAVATLALMVGALTLSRAVGDGALSDEILSAARRQIRDLEAGPAA